MAENEKPIAVPVPAATILLLRDGAEGLEVFMVKRHHQIDFVAGALVFPIYAISAAHTNDAVAAQNRVSAAAGLVLLFGLGSILGPLASGGAMSSMGADGYYVVLAATLAASLAVTAITR